MSVCVGFRVGFGGGGRAVFSEAVVVADCEASKPVRSFSSWKSPLLRTTSLENSFAAHSPRMKGATNFGHSCSQNEM